LNTAISSGGSVTVKTTGGATVFVGAGGGWVGGAAVEVNSASVGRTRVGVRITVAGWVGARGVFTVPGCGAQAIIPKIIETISVVLFMALLLVIASLDA
jgi:hypothetical protein